jgi:hypothetical protein
MSEEQVQPAAEEQVTEEAVEAKKDVAAELQTLGQQLVAATRALLESPEAQELKGQFQQGLESLEKSVSKVVKETRETEVAKKVEGSVSEATAKAKERGMMDTVSDSLVTALHAVNTSLQQAVEKVETHNKEKASKAKASAPQEIEVKLEDEDAPVDVEIEQE